MYDTTDRTLIAALCGDIGESCYPYRELAEKLRITEEEVLTRLRGYQQQGVMRRLGAILRHQQVGVAANGMSVWNVPEDDIARVAAVFAATPEVSHCYERPRLPDWPYNLFAMIHAHTEARCREHAAQLAIATGITDYDILFSIREFKKTSMVYLG